MVNYQDISNAYDKIKHLITKTPLLTSDRLNETLGYRLFVKAEPLQRIGAFKFRGACNAILSLENDNPIIAYSSGNHAQAIALVAKLAGKQATIIMPEDAPKAKIEGTKSYGAQVILYDRYHESREEIGEKLTKETGAVLVKPYDDERVIAGQGTIGIELVEQMKAQGVEPAALLCCAGGGGLISGMSLAVHEIYKDLPIYACEPQNFDDIQKSLQTGQIESNHPDARSLCDAILTPCAGDLTWPIIKEHVTAGISVSDDDALRAMQTAYRYLKLVAEPGGSVAFASALAIEDKLQQSFKGCDVVAVITGGNVDDEVFMRALNMQGAL